MKVNLNNLSCSCLFHLIKNTYKYIFKWDEYSKYSNDERLKKKADSFSAYSKERFNQEFGVVVDDDAVEALKNEIYT
ncbi:MAG: hypothetical protein E6294_06940, partial [Klebsiella sp.]|nr:hypothetical protein [Klebsiella sp.]